MTAEAKMMPRNRKWFHGMMAFPQPVELIGKGGTEAYHAGDELVEGAGGMELRDWFATFAPEPDENYIGEQIDLHYDGKFRLGPIVRSQQEIRADHAYEWADAMIAARAK